MSRPFEKTSKTYELKQKFNKKCKEEEDDAIKDGRLKVWKMSEEERKYYDRL